jgi:hypothetical protein
MLHWNSRGADQLDRQAAYSRFEPRWHPRTVIFFGSIIVGEAAAQMNTATCRDESSSRLFLTRNNAAA